MSRPILRRSAVFLMMLAGLTGTGCQQFTPSGMGECRATLPPGVIAETNYVGGITARDLHYHFYRDGRVDIEKRGRDVIVDLGPARMRKLEEDLKRSALLKIRAGCMASSPGGVDSAGSWFVVRLDDEVLLYKRTGYAEWDEILSPIEREADEKKASLSL